MTLPKTAFKKGEKRPGQGRPKGSLDKGNALIREMIVQALDGAGGVDYLIACAHDPKSKSAFLGLIGKVMPVQVEADVNANMTGSIEVRFVKPAA